MRFKALVSLLIAISFAGWAHAQTIGTPPPAPAPDPENTWLLDLSTGGRVTIQLRPDVAPKMVERIKLLTRRGFYNGLTFHRVIEGFMAQGGDPKGDGTGGSELPDIAAEFNGLPHMRGSVAAARAADPNSANSQFYIMLAPKLTLDGNYTVFGRVISGMAFVDTLNRGEPPTLPSTILQASIASDNRPPPPASAAPPAAALGVAPGTRTPAGIFAPGERHGTTAGPAVPPPPSFRVPDPPKPRPRKRDE